MNYGEARSKVLEGTPVRESSWKGDRKIRLATDGDVDYLNFDSLDGLIVTDCPSKECDCVVCLYQPTEAETLSKNWEVVN